MCRCVCVCDRENCTLLGTSIAPHGLTAVKTEPTRSSRSPAKSKERGGVGLKHAPVKSRTDATHKLTVAKEHTASSPQKRRNISRPVTRTLDKPEVIGRLNEVYITGNIFLLKTFYIMHCV